MSAADKRAERLRTFDEEIARKIAEAASSGELRIAKDYGKPFTEDSGWDATPDALRMPMKILKDSGVTPPEIALFHERARLRSALASCAEAIERERLQRALNDVETTIAFRLERLRIDAKL